MACTLVSRRFFQVLRQRDRLIVRVGPPLDAGHSLALEDVSPNKDDIRIRVLDCDDRDGSPDTAAIQSERYLGIDAVAIVHADGLELVEVEEPAMAAANGGAPPPPAAAPGAPSFQDAEPPPVDVAVDAGRGPMFGADEPAAAAPPPAPVPRPTPVAAPPPGPEPEPVPDDAAPAEQPRIGYALLDAPKVAVVGVPFAVRVGLSKKLVEGIADRLLRRPQGVGKKFTLQVQLQGDIEALAIMPGSSWTLELEVGPDNQHPTAEVRFVAVAEAAGRGVELLAFFSIGGQAIGWATRPISIVAAAGDRVPAALSHDASDLAPPGEHPPDLTIQISDDPNREPGFLMWVVTVPPALKIDLPNSEKLHSHIGTEGEEFAKGLMDQIPATQPRDLHETMLGIGQTIADHVPSGVIDTYLKVEEACAAKGRVPTVLIQTREPYVPWELAVLELEPQGGRSPFLGARASIGRWILPERGRGPMLPPPPNVKVRTMAVVSGDYRREGWASLPEARKEAQELVSEFEAKPIDASKGPVSSLLKGRPRAQALHFAIHGKFSPEGRENGMILVDGDIGPHWLRGNSKLGTPFVFLNACQLGAGDKVLGDYAGLAHSFLMTGASAVIAPLWNVRDTIAREISLEFYRTVYGSAQRGEPLTAGEAMRRVRAKFTGRSQNATYLAYQLYGDPNLQLTH